MEPAAAPAALDPQLESADDPTAAERLELLAEELREAIRRKLEPRD